MTSLSKRLQSQYVNFGKPHHWTDEANRASAERARMEYYGNTGLVKQRCPRCRCRAFVIDGRFTCCGRKMPYEPNLVSYGQPTEVSEKAPRKRPSQSEQAEIMERQKGKCYWCGWKFGRIISYKGKRRIVQINWDHVIPFVWRKDNKLGNFVAACRWCNHWKGSHLFDDLALAQQSILEKWRQLASRPDRLFLTDMPPYGRTQ